jgi:hypothetical protein
MFVKEIELYVDYFEKLISETEPDERGVKLLREVKENIEAGMELCMTLADKKPFPDENLASIPICVEKSRKRMEKGFAEFIERGE